MDEGENNEGRPVTDSADSLPHNDVYGENLLLNNSVEKWDMEICEHPLNWLLPHGYCNKVTRSSVLVFEGKYSARMKALEKGSTARIAQLVQITPGSKIRIRFNYYVVQWKANGARTYCYFRTDSQESTNISIAELRSIYTNEEYYIIRGGGYGEMYLPHTTDTWLVFDETITAPNTANYFEFGVNSYYGTVIYIDDFYISESE